MSVHYKCLPMYEYIRPGIYALFNQNGDYLTNDPKVIEALNAAAPFIERVDKVEVAEEADVADEVEQKAPAPAKSRAKN